MRRCRPHQDHAPLHLTCRLNSSSCSIHRYSAKGSSSGLNWLLSMTSLPEVRLWVVVPKLGSFMSTGPGGGGLWKVETVKLRAADTYDVIMASTASKTKKNTTITAIPRGSTVSQERGQIHGKAAEMRPTTFWGVKLPAQVIWSTAENRGSICNGRAALVCLHDTRHSALISDWLSSVLRSGSARWRKKNVNNRGRASATSRLRSVYSSQAVSLHSPARTTRTSKQQLLTNTNHTKI